LFVHVKRLNTDGAQEKQLNMKKRTRELERIPRNLVVAIRFLRDLSDDEMQQFVKKAKAFIPSAHVGQKLSVCGQDDRPYAICEADHEGRNNHVLLCEFFPARWLQDDKRLSELLSGAYKQFMSSNVNVIAVTSNWHDDVEDYENALLGKTYERWNERPPRGRVVESGRETDGFWSGNDHPESQVASFFYFNPSSGSFWSRLWLRSEAALAPDARQLTEDVFDTDSGTTDNRKAK
jgi:hypothetical protein